MPIQTHISTSVDGDCEHEVDELRNLTRVPIERKPSTRNTVVLASVMDDYPVVDDKVTIEKRRLNRRLRIIGENAAHEVARAASFIMELKNTYPGGVAELDACLVKEKADIYARVATKLGAEARRYQLRVRDLQK